MIFSLKNRYANKAEKSAAVLKIITTFATVVVFTAVMKNILESPIKKAQILNIKKGDVLGVAQVAGIMGAKQTANLIPMCHPLLITSVDISFNLDESNNNIIINSEVKTTGKTGVEMEALSAVSIAALTVYDMCKSVDRWMKIESIELLEKQGGKSGHIRRED